jgi:hypothetical protein
MTRVLLVPALVLMGAFLAGCGAKSNQPTAQERDLGPASTSILGGAADGKFLHVFSASISTTAAGPPRFSATFLYVGSGSDRLVRVTTPLGTATLAQPLSSDDAVPVDVPLRPAPGAAPAGATGSTVQAAVRLADHGGVSLSVPVLRPTATPTVSSAS